jgi:DNA-binding GntR family transcriptional regulator
MIRFRYPISYGPLICHAQPVANFYDEAIPRFSFVCDSREPGYTLPGASEFGVIHRQHLKIINAIKAHNSMDAYMAAKQHIEHIIQTNIENKNSTTGI